MRALVDGSQPRQAAPSLEDLRSRRTEILEVCANNGASNVWVFGSVARGENDDESDVDLLADIEARRSLFDLAALIGELEDALGCPVNIVERQLLKYDRFAANVLRDLVPL